MPVKLGRELFVGLAMTMVLCGFAVTGRGWQFTLGKCGSCQPGNDDKNVRDMPVEVGELSFRGTRVVFTAAGRGHSGVVKSERMDLG